MSISVEETINRCMISWRSFLVNEKFSSMFLSCADAALEFCMWVSTAGDGCLMFFMVDASSFMAFPNSMLILVHGSWIFIPISDATCNSRINRRD